MRAWTSREKDIVRDFNGLTSSKATKHANLEPDRETMWTVYFKNAVVRTWTQINGPERRTYLNKKGPEALTAGHG